MVEAAEPPTGRAALVTGATRGLGRAVAEELARRRWSLLGLGCRRPPEPPPPPPPLPSGARTLLLPGDLADPDVPARIVRRFLEFSGGRLDLLVNNAGVFRAGLLPTLAEAEWDRQLAVNLSAPFRLLRAAAEALTAARGSAVNVSSLVGARGLAGGAAYSAAKCALEGLTRAAAVELGPAGVRVNAVIPGFLAATDMGRDSRPQYVAAVLARSPLGRPAETAAAARLVADLAEMPAVTGQVLSLDGRVGPGPAPPFPAP